MRGRGFESGGVQPSTNQTPICRWLHHQPPASPASGPEGGSGPLARFRLWVYLVAELGECVPSAEEERGCGSEQEEAGGERGADERVAPGEAGRGGCGLGPASLLGVVGVKGAVALRFGLAAE